MALIPCPNCTNSVSDSALTCPHCKTKIDHKIKSKSYSQKPIENITSTNNYTSTNTLNDSDINDSDNKANYFAVICACICIVSVFFPWLKVSSSASFMGQSAHFDSGGISGLNIPGAQISLLLSIIGAVLAIKNLKWTLFAALINLLIGIGYALGWFTTELNYNYNGYGMSAKASLDPQAGLYVFIISSFLFIIASISSFSNSNND